MLGLGPALGWYMLQKLHVDGVRIFYVAQTLLTCLQRQEVDTRTRCLIDDPQHLHATVIRSGP